jgi:hypothetical protein
VGRAHEDRHDERIPSTGSQQPNIKEFLDEEKGCSMAVGSPRFFETLDQESPIAIADVRILERMIQQYGREQIQELVATLAK